VAQIEVLLFNTKIKLDCQFTGRVQCSISFDQLFSMCFLSPKFMNDCVLTLSNNKDNKLRPFYENLTDATFFLFLLISRWYNMISFASSLSDILLQLMIQTSNYIFLIKMIVNYSRYQILRMVVIAGLLPVGAVQGTTSISNVSADKLCLGPLACSTVGVSGDQGGNTGAIISGDEIFVAIVLQKIIWLQ